MPKKLLKTLTLKTSLKILKNSKILKQILDFFWKFLEIFYIFEFLFLNLFFTF
jgi:hypothetical protein